MNNFPALQRTVLDLVEEYDAKSYVAREEISAFETSVKRIELASSVAGQFGARVIWFSHSVTEKDVQKSLLVSGWKAIYDRLQIDRIASATDKKLFERTIADPPPLTFENAKATFGDYLLRPRFHILRGMAEAFCSLEDAYKSHSKVKIGIAGLPKRVILTGFGDYSYGSWGRERFRDITNALAAYRGQPMISGEEIAAMDSALRGVGEAELYGGLIRTYNGATSETPNRGLRIKKFANGNAHVFFSPEAMRDINLALAEFYGDVLPDVEDDDAPPPVGTAVSKDLQYYPTPARVVADVLDYAGIHALNEYSGRTATIFRVLEPSCGCGRFLDEIARRGHKPFGVEYHRGRADEARAKGHAVLTANFLEQPPTADFDRVVMNPPFYGRHYIKHVRHALKFLKPGGILVTVLPATAWFDHKALDGEWRDLPVASFAESGTNVPTGYLIMRAAE